MIFWYDHPILSMRNVTDKELSRPAVKLARSEKKNFKRKAHRKTRRLVRIALKGNDIRCNKRPGNSWNLW